MKAISSVVHILICICDDKKLKKNRVELKQLDSIENIQY
jgi:hypothetical protein